MTPEVWQRVKSLVGDALEQPDNERSAFVSKSGEATTVRREAQSILAQSAARLEACVEHVTATITQDTSLIGQRIGALSVRCPFVRF